ncbi:DUF4921 family protein [Corynebacterium choanae]|uniref:DUF4921 domain-containing protein n=1 Tax=Corynebacterium choanae TaxID=1862358 RepID=A0A3G6J7F1_9CORY|nr:DUF4921 family protein [Corynebacterium choanae]AZA13916.1 hypothetical protein CCHOA_07620 [Corynebacterium choanae]
MSNHVHSRPHPLYTMADGTIKQVNPFSGTEVWTVPGRGNRPLAQPAATADPLTPEDHTSYCAFCADNLLATPPEKSRMIKQPDGTYEIIDGVAPAELFATQPEFRRVPNLFEIVSYDYWRENYGFAMDRETSARMAAYIADDTGREHVKNIVRTRLKAAGLPLDEVAAMSEQALLARAGGYFAGGHDVIIGRRHFTDNATTTAELSSSGTLSVAEHRALIRFTVHAMADLYHRNRYTPYVAVFQNWLKPAGASFDHLHKQLVAIDERGVTADQEIDMLRHNPNMYNEWGVNYAHYHNLVIAENDHAIVFAGIGHRYPALEVYSKSATVAPWEMDPEEINGMSDLVHACHAAAGPDVSCNEEWHHKPVDVDIPMPWRIVIKWRISTLAGFEGGTKIYLNTLSPYNVRDRMVANMYLLRDEGKIDGSIRIATECQVDANPLRYNPAAAGGRP